MNKNKLIRLIIYLTIFGFIIGLVKVEFFLLDVSPIHLKIARITSYVSLGIGAIFFYFMVIVSIIASFFTVEFLKLGTNFETSNFFKSINIFVFSLFVNEIFKLFITIIFYENGVEVKTKDDMINNLENNSIWLDLINLSDITFLFIDGFLASLYLSKYDKNISTLESVLCMIPLMFSFIIIRIL